ncbi:MAG: zinc-dependent dehydrogenase [Elusimicrobiota bacterium]
MKAAVYLGPGKTEIREIEKPVISSKEVLIKVKTCAVCGTDVRIFYHGQKNVVPPHVTGHEIAGVIEEIGKNANVPHLKEGDKVTVVTCVGCGKCKYCKDKVYNLCDTPRYIGYYYPGGFTEYVKIPEEAVVGNNILKAGGRLDYEEISMVEPLSCCINGQQFLNIRKDDFVVIFGSGPIGCMHAELAKAQGAGAVVMFDVSDQRLELAKTFNIDHRINSMKVPPIEKVMELTSGIGADVIITACSANVAQEQAVAMVAKRGRISMFAGLPKDNPTIKFDSNVIHYKEASVFGAFASNRVHYEKALDLIAKGKINAKNFVTHRFPLEKIVDAMETTRSGAGLKSIIVITENMR